MTSNIRIWMWVQNQMHIQLKIMQDGRTQSKLGHASKVYLSEREAAEGDTGCIKGRDESQGKGGGRGSSSSSSSSKGMGREGTPVAYVVLETATAKGLTEQ